MASDKIILYDDNCPLCCWYTDAFVKTGLLTENGRQAFAEIDPDAIAQQLDLERSKDEIPLLDTQGGVTLYGIDSLLYILGQRWPWMVTIARWIPINWFLHRFYKFISYNRRVIVAAETPEGSFDCSPQFNYFYRYFYLAFVMLIGTWGATSFLSVIEAGNSSFLLLPGLFLLIAAPMLRLTTHRARVKYAGIMTTPYLILGFILGISSVLPFPLWLGGSLALALAIWMWIHRYHAAMKP